MSAHRLATTFQILALLLCCPAVVIAAEDDAPHPVTRIASPNGRYAVRLREGQTIGNAKYDRAELIARKDAKVLYRFKGTGGEDSEGFDGYGGGFGAFEGPTVVWSRDSRYVAIFCHDHRTGDTHVVEVTHGEVHECEIPETIVPRIEQEFDNGRQWQTWLRPVRWSTHDVLLANYSGVIRNYHRMPQRKDSEGQLAYEYLVKIRFGASGAGKVIAITRRKFDTYYVQ